MAVDKPSNISEFTADIAVEELIGSREDVHFLLHSSDAVDSRASGKLQTDQ